MWADESPRFRRLCWLPGFLAGRKRCSQDQGLLSSVFFRSSTLLQAVVTTDELVQRLSWIQVPTGSSAVPRMRLWLPCSSGYQQGLFLGCVCVCVCVQFPGQQSDPCPLHWEHSTLTTRATTQVLRAVCLICRCCRLAVHGHRTSLCP